MLRLTPPSLRAYATKFRRSVTRFQYTPTGDLSSSESCGCVAMQHTIVFLDRDTVGAPLRQPNFPHSYKEYADTPVSCILDRLRDATIAILNKVPMRAETLAHLPK